MAHKVSRREYDRAVDTRLKVVLKNGQAAITAAEKRLCNTCHYEAKGISGMCGVNSLLAPLTINGEDCPYHLPKSFAKFDK